MIRERSEQGARWQGGGLDGKDQRLAIPARSQEVIAGYRLFVNGYRTEQILRTACNLVGADFQLIVGQAHRAQERVPAGVASEVRKVWVSPQTR